jgi:nucleotide sugar dehydrogenase
VSLSISVFGLGYVGSVSAACFASMGHRVIGVDVNPDKVEMMESGRSPIIEARMNELVAEGNRGCRLHATVDSIAAVLDSDVSFVCVGTPSLRSGKLDLSHIEKVSREIGAALKTHFCLTQHSLAGDHRVNRPADSGAGERTARRNRFHRCLQPGVYARGKCRE